MRLEFVLNRNKEAKQLVALNASILPAFLAYLHVPSSIFKAKPKGHATQRKEYLFS